MVYTAGGWGSGIGLSLGDLELKDVPDLYRFGSQSRCALVLLEDGTVIGNYFSCLVGKKAFEWMVTGVYFEEQGQLDELLGPVLDALRTYAP